MFTCRTCKLLKQNQAKKDILSEEEAAYNYSPIEILTQECKATCQERHICTHGCIKMMNAKSIEWHCPYYQWNIKPLGFGCKHWQNMNGKHWI